MMIRLQVLQSFVGIREKALSGKHNYNQKRANINLEQFSSAPCSGILRCQKKEFAAALVRCQHVALCNTSHQCFLLAPEFFTLGIPEPLLKGRQIALFPFQ